MIYLIYFLATLWALGWVVLPLWAALWQWNENEKGMSVFIVTVIWPLDCVLSFMPWAFISEAQSDNLALLKKNEWYCSQPRSHTTTTLDLSGKTMVPVTTTQQVCDQYQRKQ